VNIAINIDVDDLERAVAFYTAALGLRPGRRLFAGSTAELLGASSPIYLLAKAGGTAPFPGAASGRNYRRHWTPVHLDFHVADLAAALERARAAGARLEGEVESFAWGTQARLRDPFGHGFCLIQPTAQGYDSAL
jgi:catechol 2,3-dioxygenase-like lactoylglutathione lyase family enzyme